MNKQNELEYLRLSGGRRFLVKLADFFSGIPAHLPEFFRKAGNGLRGLGKKIRDAQMEKVPYMLVLGDKEAEENVVAVRARKTGETETMPLADFARKLCEEVRTKAR